MAVLAPSCALSDPTTPSSSGTPPSSGQQLERSLGYRIGYGVGRVARGIMRLILLVLLLLIGATLAFQIPAVQRWAAREASRQVSQLIGTEFHVDHIGLTPFTRFELWDVYALDERADTLLQADHLGVQLLSPLRSLLANQLDIEQVELAGARVQLYRNRAHPRGNWDFLIDKLGLRRGDGPPDGTQPIQLDLRETLLRDSYVSFEDSLAGTSLSLALDTLDLAFDKFDLPAAHFEGDRLLAAGLSVQLRRYVGVEASGIGGANTGAANLPSLDTDAGDSRFNLLPQVLLTLPDLQLRRSNISFLDERRPRTAEGTFDAGNVQLRNLNLVATDIALSADSLGLSLGGLSGSEAVSGLTLSKFAAQQLSLTNRELRLEDYNLSTPGSSLGHQLRLRVPVGSDWRSLATDLRYDLKLSKGKVSIAELLSLVPQAAQVAGLQTFSDAHIVLGGDISGTVDRLKVDDLSLLLPDGTALDADISIRNLRNPKEAWLFVDVRALHTEVDEVSNWLPGIVVPPALERLGAVDFSGSFTGFVTDFVAYGDLRTSLGRATLDTRFVRRGQVPTYTGGAKVLDFDLGKFLQNPELGRLTANIEIIQGRGLKRENLQLDLIGNVGAFDFRGYNYHNLAIKGRIDPNGFSGQLESRDPNADFTFDGMIDTRADQQQFGFNIDVRNLNLNALHLSKFGWEITGDFEVSSNSLDLDELEGSVTVDSLQLRHTDGRIYDLKRLRAEQAIAPDGDKRLVFISPQVQFELSGRYQLLRLPRVLQAAFAKTYPELYAKANLPAVITVDSTNTRISLDARLMSVDSLLDVFRVPVRGIDGAIIAMTFDREREDLDLSFSGVSPVVAGITLDKFGFDLRGQSGDLQLEGDIAHLGFGKFGFERVHVFSEYADGELRFGVSSDTTTRVLGEVRLGGSIILGDTAIVFQLDPTSHLDVSGERWIVDAGNELTFGNRRLTAKDVVLRSGERFIEVESLGQRGVNVLLRKFDLDVLNGYLNPDKIQLAGEVDAFFTAEDLYAQEGITASVAVDTFRVNGVDWGAIQALVTRADSTQAVTLYTTFSRFGQQAIVDAQLATAAGQVVDGEARPAQYFNATVTSEDFDMSFLSYFIPGITDLQGKLGADLHFFGTPDDITPEGGILVNDVGITVDYLQTRYFADNQFLSVDSRLLDATGKQITDRFGNVATLNGGLVHTGLKNWGLDVSMTTDRLEVLNTNRRDNPLYYGSAFMSGRVAFAGPFNLTDIDIDATALADTRVVFPVNGTSGESELRFIRFVSPEDSLQQAAATVLRGLSMDMNIAVTPAAELLLLFDESSGDIMRAQGSGNIDFNISRTGTYNMYGRFEIAEGSYLFTLLQVVNKPFTVLEGGTINWTGDPFSAELNLTARYEGLSAAPEPLILEYIAARPDLEAAAGNRTPINLLMKLTGELRRPNLAFEITLPDLQGELRGYVNSKLALIKQDDDLLNRQVFGLIVIGQFLPQSTDIQVSSVGVNTISELFSNQLSYLLTELFSSLTGANSALTGIDVDINFQNNSSLAGVASAGAAGTNLQTRLRTYFLEDRLEIGGSLSIAQSGPQQGNLTAGRFEVTYAISENRRLRLKTFVSRDNNFSIGIRNRAGVGVTWRRDFDSFAELFGIKPVAVPPDEKPRVFPAPKQF